MGTTPSMIIKDVTLVLFSQRTFNWLTWRIIYFFGIVLRGTINHGKQNLGLGGGSMEKKQAKTSSSMEINSLENQCNQTPKDGKHKNSPWKSTINRPLNQITRTISKSSSVSLSDFT